MRLTFIRVTQPLYVNNFLSTDDGPRMAKEGRDE